MTTTSSKPKDSEKMKNLIDWLHWGTVAKLSGIHPALRHPKESDPIWSNKINTNKLHIIQLPNIRRAKLSITEK